MAHETGWTESRVAVLEREWGNGMTAREIGEATGMSRSAVIGKAQRLGLKTSKAVRRRNISKGLTDWHGKGKPAPEPRKPRVAKLKVKPPPKAAPRLTVAPTAGVPLVDATASMCRYPVAGEGRAMVVCGQPAHAIGGWRSPFCKGHYAVCYQPPGTHTPRRSVSPQPRSI